VFAEVCWACRHRRSQSIRPHQTSLSIRQHRKHQRTNLHLRRAIKLFVCAPTHKWLEQGLPQHSSLHHRHWQQEHWLAQETPASCLQETTTRSHLVETRVSVWAPMRRNLHHRNSPQHRRPMPLPKYVLSSARLFARLLRHALGNSCLAHLLAEIRASACAPMSTRQCRRRPAASPRKIAPSQHLLVGCHCAAFLHAQARKIQRQRRLVVLPL